MRRRITGLLIWLSCFFTTTYANPDSVWIKGRIVPSKPLVMSFTDVDDQYHPLMIKPDKDGNISMGVPLRQPTLGVVAAANFVYAWLIPGDTLFVNISSGSSDRYNFSYRNGERNREASFWYGLSEKFKILSFTFIKYSPGMNLNYYIRQMDDRYREIQAYADSSITAMQLSPAFRETVSHHIFYYYLTYFGDPVYKPENDIKNFSGPFIEKMKSFKDKLKRADLMNNRTYLLAAWNYNRFLARYRYNGDFSTATMYQSAVQNFEPPTRDWVAFKALKDGLISWTEGINELCDRYAVDCPGTPYISYIDSLREQMRNVVTGPQLLATRLNTPANDSVSWQRILDSNKGNVVLIDFWASWCGPCKAEFPFSGRLSDSLKNEPLKFVYISIDTDKNAWKKSMAEIFRGKDNEQHYWISGGFDAEFIRKLGIKSIPRYMLINKAGKIITIDGPRPSSDKLKNLLTVLLAG